jgi:uncharacterized protein (DUF2252 family)
MRPWISLAILVTTLTGCGSLPGTAALARAGDASALGKKHAASRRDPAAAIREANAVYAKRDAALIAKKFDTLAGDDFSFFRGTVFLFDADAADEPALATSLHIPLQGDAHLENLGTYRTADGRVAYDLNDFDEAATGPYTYELARMAVSIRLAAKANGLHGADVDGLVTHYLDAYGQALKAQSSAKLAQPATSGLGAAAGAAIAEGSQIDRAEFLSDFGADGRFKLGKKLRAVPSDLAQRIGQAVEAYGASRRGGSGFFAVKDVAERIAGTASLGRYRWAVWVEGPTASPQDDVLLEVKEEAAPALAPGASADPGKRVADAYRYFLPSPDPLLGALKVNGASCLVREIQPVKASVALDTLTSANAFKGYLEAAALLTARAHARSGKAQAIAADLATKAPAIAAFADRYDGVVSDDRKTFKSSLK